MGISNITLFIFSFEFCHFSLESINTVPKIFLQLLYMLNEMKVAVYPEGTNLFI